MDSDGGNKPGPASLDLLDELELLLHRKGRMSVLLVTVIALALCFLVVGIVMATGIMLVTFFLFVNFNDNPPATGTVDLLGTTV
ncbi:hypothetical protein ZHAS_00020044 [Anopheles sinensis]|uniref:Uncharacterized protein n=1 Tax=Anopheles sinensis TaxID=74873 RepID=A0A084WNT2_ANOSI|nr:hypothetical protein ZHAS_00020044 [Anopheles sinensis]